MLRDPEGKGEESKSRAPFRPPARTEGRLGSGLSQFPEWQLGCTIRAALVALPTPAHHAPRGCHPLFYTTLERVWALCGGRPGASPHESPAALRVTPARRQGVGVERLPAPAGRGAGQGRAGCGSPGAARSWRELCSLLCSPGVECS